MVRVAETWVLAAAKVVVPCSFAGSVAFASAFLPATVVVVEVDVVGVVVVVVAAAVDVASVEHGHV